MHGANDTMRSVADTLRSATDTLSGEADTVAGTRGWLDWMLQTVSRQIKCRRVAAAVSELDLVFVGLPVSCYLSLKSLVQF